MKLLMGLKFKLGFVPVFHFPVHCGRFQFSVPLFSNLHPFDNLLNIIFLLL